MRKMRQGLPCLDHDSGQTRRLRTHAEALREDIDAEKRGQYLDIVLDESDRMTRLVARLLELSRLEGGTVAKEPLELSALIREVWGPLELTMAQRRACRLSLYRPTSSFSS